MNNREIFELFAQMKHKTGTHRMNIVNLGDAIANCPSDDFEEFYGMSIKQAGQRIINNISELTQEFEKFEKQLRKDGKFGSKSTKNVL